MEPIKVVIQGALGKMGREVANAISHETDLKVIGAVDSAATTASSYSLPGDTGSIPLSNALEDVILGAKVVVDFSTADGAMRAIEVAASNKVNVVIGSTGLTELNLKDAEKHATANNIGIIVAPNFAIGGVLLIHLAKLAAPFFEYADLTEVHHEAKIDAPSGTALAIAQSAVTGKGRAFVLSETQKETLAGTRGGDFEGVSIHSGRMPGRVAHHELVFGALGQTLTIRHDSINRESFMPGVLMAIREAVNSQGLTVGLENIMGLG